MKTSYSLLGQAVILEPVANTHNVIQPLIDATSALILRNHSPSQSADLLRFEGSAGNLLSSVDSTGAFTGAAASPSGSVILAPATLGRNTITPTTDAGDGLNIVGHSATATARLLRVIGAGASSSSLSVRPPGSPSGISVFMGADNGADIAVLIQGANTVGGGAQLLMLIGQDGSGNVLSQVDYQPAGAVQWSLQTTDAPATAVQVAAMAPLFSSGLSASYKGQLTWSISDFNSPGGRLALVMEADGTAARIGFLGAAAALRQTGGAATANAIYGATEQGMLQKAYNALRTFGLLT